MLGNIGNLFVKCMRQVTKGHLYHLYGVLDYYVMYRQKAQSVCETSAKVTNWVIDPFRWLCEPLCKVCGYGEGILMSPLSCKKFWQKGVL